VSVCECVDSFRSSFTYTLHPVDTAMPDKAVARLCKADAAQNTLSVCGRVYDLSDFDKVVVVGCGKAVVPMTLQMEDVLRYGRMGVHVCMCVYVCMGVCEWVGTVRVHTPRRLHTHCNLYLSLSHTPQHSRDISLPVFGLCVTKYNHVGASVRAEMKKRGNRIELEEAAHPVSDENSVKYTRLALELLRTHR
jgi:glycerate-2-kinase